MAFLFTDARSINPFSGEWLPELGPVLPIVLCLAGVAVLIRMLFRTAESAPETVAPSPEPLSPEKAGSGPAPKVMSNQCL
jgi:hypothetical protein